MNGQPHAHEIKLARRYALIDAGPFEVTYGDTVVVIPRSTRKVPSSRSVARAVKKAVRRHDRGSMEAQQRADALAKIRAEISELPAGQWGSVS